MPVSPEQIHPITLEDFPIKESQSPPSKNPWRTRVKKFVSRNKKSGNIERSDTNLSEASTLVNDKITVEQETQPITFSSEETPSETSTQEVSQSQDKTLVHSKSSNENKFYNKWSKRWHERKSKESPSTNDLKKDHINTISHVLSIFSKRQTSQEKTPQTLEFLEENMPEVVEFALPEPKLHKRLIKSIFDECKTNQRDGNSIDPSRRIIWKELVNEVVSQLEKETVDDSGKSEFVDKLLKKIRFVFYNPTKFKEFSIGVLLDTLYSATDKSSFLKSQSDNLLYRLAILGLRDQNHRTPESSLKELKEKYGITKIHRYGSKFLLNQIAENGENPTNKKRALIIVAKSDFSRRGNKEFSKLLELKKLDKNDFGSFDRISNYEEILKLKKHGIEPMIFEIGSGDELQTLIEQTDPSILDTISQVQIDAHVELDSKIILGKGDDDIIKDETHLEQLKGSLQRLPNLEKIVLTPCMSGRKTKKTPSSIARRISKKVDKITVEAPKYIVGTIPKIGENGLKLNPIENYYLSKNNKQKRIYLMPSSLGVVKFRNGEKV